MLNTICDLIQRSIKITVFVLQFITGSLGTQKMLHRLAAWGSKRLHQAS